MSLLAIALQICPVDALLGQRLARLICAIERERRNDIEFIIAARRDTNKDLVRQIAATAKEKFAAVHVITGTRNGTGWPMGCNDLWAETMMRTSILQKQRALNASGVLTFEADNIPLTRDWLTQLAAAWQGRTPGLRVMGSDCGDHINGNAVFEVGLCKQYPALSGAPADMGWDCAHGALLKSIGLCTPLIAQRYAKPSITTAEVEEITAAGAVMLHGVKGTTAIEIAEAKLAA